MNGARSLGGFDTLSLSGIGKSTFPPLTLSVSKGQAQPFATLPQPAA